MPQSFDHEALVERFFETLINGDRPAARAVVDEVVEAGYTPDEVITELFWPTRELFEKLYRSDQLSQISYHYASRLLRVLVDQNASRLARHTFESPVGTGQNRLVLAYCGLSDAEELGAQMAVDLLEAGGFTVRFAGGGVPADEIHAQVQDLKPHALLMFCSAASDLPGIRQMFDTLREINACPNTQFVVGGGVFNRAEGLAEEIGADLSATDPLELVDLMIAKPAARAVKTPSLNQPVRRAEQRKAA
jgi:methanogenic corrinoid protein MtbC1